MKLFLQKNAKFSSAGGSAPRPPQTAPPIANFWLRACLCEHVILFDHVIDWANSRILKTESNFSKRLTAESWFILSRPKVINRSDGESFPIVYRSLL